MRNKRQVLDLLKGEGFDPKIIVDVGVATGTPGLYETWPDAHYVLVEALPKFSSNLAEIAKSLKKCDIEAAFAGRDSSSVKIATNPDHVHAYAAAETAPSHWPVSDIPVKTVDEIVMSRINREPNTQIVLKIDVDGAEIDVLEGCFDVLKSECAVVIEAALLDREQSRFLQICRFMQDRKYEIFDIIEPLNRPGDDFLWQVDLVFVPQSSKIRQARGYNAKVKPPGVVATAAPVPPVLAPQPSPTIVTRQYTTNIGQPFNVSYEKRQPAPATLMTIAVHKCGSVLLDDILASAARELDITAIDLEAQAYMQGLYPSHWNSDTVDFVLSEKAIFYSFRSLYPIHMHGDYGNTKKVYLVRDVRDAIVSLYFSESKSHFIPESGFASDDMKKKREEVSVMSLGEFIRSGKADWLAENMRGVMRFCQRGDNHLLLKYENLFFKKADTLKEVLTYFEIDHSAIDLNAVVAPYNIFHQDEDSTRHIRKGYPGDFKVKLNDEDKKFVNERYGDLISYFGYENA